MRPGSPADHRQKVRLLERRRDYLLARQREGTLTTGARSELAALAWALPHLWRVWEVERATIEASMERRGESMAIEPPDRADFTDERDYEIAVDDFWLKVDALEEAAVERRREERP
jgi:hypothetical protein